MPGDHIKGAWGFIPLDAILRLPYGRRLWDIIYLYGGRILFEMMRSEVKVGGFDIGLLSTKPKTASEMEAYQAWLELLDEATDIRRRIGAGARVEFAPDLRYPVLDIPAQVLYKMNSGMTLWSHGFKAVGLGVVDLTVMGADPRADVVVSGNSVDGIPFLMSAIAQTFTREDWALFLPKGTDPGKFFVGDTDILRWGRQPEIDYAMEQMFGEKRELFYEVVRKRGGWIKEAWWMPPLGNVEGSWLQRSGLLKGLMREGRARYNDQGKLELLLESIGLKNIYRPAYPYHGDKAQLYLDDLIDVTRWHASLLDNQSCASAEREMFARFTMAVSGRFPRDTEFLHVFREGIILPIYEAKYDAIEALKDIAPEWSEMLANNEVAVPLKFILQALTVLPPFTGKILTIPAGIPSAEKIYVDPEAVLETQEWNKIGQPVSPYAKLLQAAMPGITCGYWDSRVLEALHRAGEKFASDPEVIRKSICGTVGGSLTGRAVHLGSLGLGPDEAAVIAPGLGNKILHVEGEQLARIMHAPHDNRKSYPDLVMVISPERAAEMQRAAGEPEIDLRQFKEGVIGVAGDLSMSEKMEAMLGLD